MPAIRRTKNFLLALGMALAAGLAAGPAGAISVGEERLASHRASVTGTVTKIDVATRRLTVRGPRGEDTYRVDPKVRALDEAKVGDSVRVDFVAGIGLTLRRGSAEVSEAGSRTATRPGAAGKPVTVVTRVLAVDRSRLMLKLRGPDGNAAEYEVADKADLAGVRVGDQVVAVIYELVAVDLAPAR